MKYVLGIDIGTTGTKTLLFSIDGELCGQAYKSYELITSEVGISEQNPDDWWDAVVSTVREAVGDRQISKDVIAISLSTQGGTVVPVDNHFNPVRPAIVWNDIRCDDEVQDFLRSGGSDEGLYKKTGWHIIPGLNLMQIRHMREKELDNFKKTAMFLSVPDYISYKMTGVCAIDLSNVGINQLGDIANGCYDPDLLDFAGITEKQLPNIVRSGEVIGHLTELAADELGLSCDTVFVSGAHDQYAVALGAGACNVGDILIGSGTCWAITCINDTPDFESGLSQSIAAVPNTWGSLWSLSSGGVCLEWLRKNIITNTSEELVSYKQIDAEVSLRKAAHNGLFFFPFSGCSTLDKKFQRAGFVGLDLSHDRFDMARAVMEGITFQIVWMLDAFKAKPSKQGIKLVGGASKSDIWCQMVADVSGMPVRIPEVADMACVGAAVLAGVGSKIFKNFEEAYSCFSVGERVINPDKDKTKEYSLLFKEYKRCAERLGSVYNL